jgi:ribokinase
MSGSGGGRVIVVGSVNLDIVLRLPQLPAPGETVLGGLLERHDGGKGANQAVAAARAGAAVHLIGAVWQDDGSAAVAALAADGVVTACMLRTAAPTGVAAVLVDDRTGENLIAVASGANALVTAGHVEASLTGLGLSADDVIVLSFELPSAPLRAAASLAAAAGARVVANPAPAMPGYAELLAGAITTPNAGELTTLTGQLGLHPGEAPAANPAEAPGDQIRSPVTGPAAERAALGQAAVALAAHTGAPVLVTIGSGGVLLAADGACGHVPGLVVDVADTTGAGDTFTGVLAASLAAGLSLRASAERAVVAAGLAVTRAGARAGMPLAAAIEAELGRPGRPGAARG